MLDEQLLVNDTCWALMAFHVQDPPAVSCPHAERHADTGSLWMQGDVR